MLVSRDLKASANAYPTAKITAIPNSADKSISEPPKTGVGNIPRKGAKIASVVSYSHETKDASGLAPKNFKITLKAISIPSENAINSMTLASNFTTILYTKCMSRDYLKFCILGEKP